MSLPDSVQSGHATLRCIRVKGPHEKRVEPYRSITRTRCACLTVLEFGVLEHFGSMEGVGLVISSVNDWWYGEPQVAVQH